MTTQGNNFCKLLLKTKEEDEEEIQEAASLAAAKTTSMDAAVAAVQSKLDGTFALKEWRTGLGAFLSGKYDLYFTHRIW